jgi:hypothetical protein
MGNISDINIRIAEITSNIKMVIFTKNDNQESIIINNTNQRIKAKHTAVNKK